MVVTALALTLIVGVVAVAPSGAATSPTVAVPKGTVVPLKFVRPFDTETIKQGAAVSFTVASSVLVDQKTVVKEGTPGSGVVTHVATPGTFGRNAKVTIGFVRTTAVDGDAVELIDIIVSPDTVKDQAAAAGTTLVGAIVLGPIGAAAGFLVRGGNVKMPAGAVAVTATKSPFTVDLPQ